MSNKTFFAALLSVAVLSGCTSLDDCLKDKYGTTESNLLNQNSPEWQVYNDKTGTKHSEIIKSAMKAGKFSYGECDQYR